MTKVEPCISCERRYRIRLSVAAYAYEFMDDPVLTDEEFDNLAKKINVNIKTGNDKLDKFFKEEFSADTGMWIHKHPEKEKLKNLYKEYYKK